MVHEGKIQWHDLVEDPEDLPKEYGRYLVTIWEEVPNGDNPKGPIEDLFLTHDDCYFMKDSKKWMFHDFEAITMRTIGLDEYANMQVIAWANPILAYRPGLERMRTLYSTREKHDS